VLSRPLAANASDGPESGTAAGGGRVRPARLSARRTQASPRPPDQVTPDVPDRRRAERTTTTRQATFRRQPCPSQDHFRSGRSVFAKRGSLVAVNDHGSAGSSPRTSRSKSASSISRVILPPSGSSMVAVGSPRRPSAAQSCSISGTATRATSTHGDPLPSTSRADAGGLVPRAAERRCDWDGRARRPPRSRSAAYGAGRGRV
jgi:hypothetical protein